MELHAALEMVKYDKRLLDWNLKQGLISQAEYDKHMKSLQDLATMSETVTLEEEDEGSGNGADHSSAQ